MDFWHEKPFSTCFVHNPIYCQIFSQRLINVALLWNHMPNFYENNVKSCARLERKKVMKVCGAGKNFRKIIAQSVKGGEFCPAAFLR